MKCFNPVYISNPLYPEHDPRPKISVPCGKCASCLKSSSDDWSIRLEEELRSSISAYFITLTYDDAHLPLQEVTVSADSGSTILPVVNLDDVSAFVKRLRSFHKRLFNGQDLLPIRFFVCSEYGPTTLRPHYHGIFFNIFPSLSSSEVDMVKIHKAIEKIWSNGFIKVDSVTSNRIKYVTKYCFSQYDVPYYLPKPGHRMSRNPGLGSSYINNEDRVNWHKQFMANYYPLPGGKKARLPRYYKDRIFSDEEKAVLYQDYLVYALEKSEEERTLFNSFHHLDDARKEVVRQERLRQKFLTRIKGNNKKRNKI